MMIRPNAHDDAAAPGGQGAVLGGKHIRLERVRLGGAETDYDLNRTPVNEQFRRPGILGARNTGIDGGHVGPIDQVGAGGDVKIRRGGGPRFDGIGNIVLAIGMLDNAGITQNAGWAWKLVLASTLQFAPSVEV